MNSLGIERHGPVALGAVAAVVLVAEGDAGLVERDQPLVGDGDAVGVARQVGQHGLGSGEGRLGVDEPVLLAEGRQDGGEGAAVAQAGMVAEELEPARRHGAAASSSRNSRRNSLESTRTGRRKAGPARHPALAVERDAAAGHDHVDVRVVGHGRAPGVEHGGDADAGAEVLRIGRDRQHRLRGGPEQEVVDHRLVVRRRCRRPRPAA